MARTSIRPCCAWPCAAWPIPMLVTDAMPPVGGTRSTFRFYGRQIEGRGETCITEDGTLAGTALDMASAVRQLCSPPRRAADIGAALRFLEPARFWASPIGSAASCGYQADMVAFEPDDCTSWEHGWQEVGAVWATAFYPNPACARAGPGRWHHGVRLLRAVLWPIR